MGKRYNLLTILGPTATGKTSLAASVANKIGGEIISADSRQVYRDMDIGTGKDYVDYIVDGESIPVHLIDIEDAGNHYNVYRFQKDFITVFEQMEDLNKFPVLCGGSGLYLEAVLRDYRFIDVPPNSELRSSLKNLSLDELADMLKSLNPKLHNTTDLTTIRRVIRAIEIEKWYSIHPEETSNMPDIHSLNVGIYFDRDTRRNRISRRLVERLNEGMIEEVQGLLDKGCTSEQLLYYGLEYKFITLYLIGEISYSEMVEKLEIAIFQFAKRQMTWFRGMEKRGTPILWVNGLLSLEEKTNIILRLLCEDSQSLQKKNL